MRRASPMAKATKIYIGTGVAALLAVAGVAIGSSLVGGGASTTPSASTPSGSVLTGKPGHAGDVLAVKIDNVGAARPATGLNDADIVYGIQVEGGLSRLMAIFDSSHMPSVVGPVRSVRESDLRILSAYNRPGLVYSGATAGYTDTVLHSPLVASRSIDHAFYRSQTRQAPNNEYVRTAGLASGQAKDIGLRFGKTPSGGADGSVARAAMPSASFGFQWDSGAYRVYLDRQRSPWTTDNVIIQHVQVKGSPGGFTYDHGRQKEPYSETVGHGTGTIFRDGKRFDVTWDRPDAGSPTTYTYNGHVMELRPGRTWIVLS